MSRPLKIALVVDDTLDSTDGVQQYVLAIGGWLTRAGHEVHYLAGQSKRTDVANVHSMSRNVRVSFNGNRLTIPLPASRSAIKALLARERYDVIHVQMPYSPFMAGRIVAAAPAATAVVGTFHILPHSGFVTFCSRLLAAAERRTLKRFNRVFAVSQAAGRFAADAFHVSSDVLPNVIDVARFAGAKPLASRPSRTAYTVLFLGRLVPRKGCRTLLEALHILRTQYHRDDVSVLLCGKGPLEPELRAYVKDNELDALVEFAGYVDEADKPRYYHSADIAVFPSTGGESFGIVLAEAMAAGTLTLAASNPGYAAVLENRQEYLFPPRDAPALAVLLERYCADPTARKTVLAWQTGHVQQFDTATVGAALVESYWQLLRASGKA